MKLYNDFMNRVGRTDGQHNCVADWHGSQLNQEGRRKTSRISCVTLPTLSLQCQWDNINMNVEVRAV
jgi:hypothetical protein